MCWTLFCRVCFASFGNELALKTHSGWAHQPPVILWMFTWYRHPLTHVVGRTRVPHVLRRGGVVWAGRGVRGSACVPADTHTAYSSLIFREGRRLRKPERLRGPGVQVWRRSLGGGHLPEKGVLQVQEITGLWSCLIHLGDNTDVVALSAKWGRSERRELQVSEL